LNEQREIGTEHQPQPDQKEIAFFVTSADRRFVSEFECDIYINIYVMQAAKLQLILLCCVEECRFDQAIQHLELTANQHGEGVNDLKEKAID